MIQERPFLTFERSAKSGKKKYEYMIKIKWTDDYDSDRCMPIGCPSSSKTFETFSTAVELLADLLDDSFIITPTVVISFVQIS